MDNWKLNLVADYEAVICEWRNSPELMKKGILKRPDKTLSLNDDKVEPSNGNAPQINT